MKEKKLLFYNAFVNLINTIIKLCAGILFGFSPSIVDSVYSFSDFITDVSVEGLRKAIQLHCNTEKYKEMDRVAKSAATDIFSYYEIAKKSVEMANLT